MGSVEGGCSVDSAGHQRLRHAEVQLDACQMHHQRLCGVGVVECDGVWWSVVECGGVWWSVVECGGVWWSVVECGGVWWSVVECGRV